MRIAVATTVVPFAKGGGRRLARELTRALAERGHEVDEILLAFWPDPEEMVEQMLALRLLDVTHEAELLICLRTPTYLLRHRNKVVWFLHHHRPAYDLLETHPDPRSPHSDAIRESIYESDRLGLGEARRVFAVSRVVADRLRAYNDLACDVLHPAFENADDYHCDEYGDFVFFPSRIVPLKRQALAVQAMAHVRSGVRLVIAGEPDLPEHLEALRELNSSLDLGGRVELVGEWIDEARKRELYARCLAVVYPPLGEDYGYVTTEAFAASKAVLTCTDSGGPLEFVQDGVNGLVLEPDPQALAVALDALARDRDQARKLGQQAKKTLGELDLRWDPIVEALTR
jgi:glycosyltransferase involved in cell wall biosynthesis